MNRLFAIRPSNSFYFPSGRSDISTIIPSLKRQALLFGKIGILNSNSFRSILRSIQHKHELLTELGWLIDKGIVFDIDLSSLPQNEWHSFVGFIKKANLNSHLMKHTMDNFDQEKLLQDVYEHNEDFINFAGGYMGLPVNKLLNFEANLYSKLMISEAFLVRAFVLWKNLDQGFQTVPLLSYFDFQHDFPNSQKSKVVEVVLNRLPTPDDTTPWEKIIDYRDDPNSRDSLLELKRWMKKISSTSTSIAEIEEELDYLLSKFQRHMKVHEIKANTETFETIIKAPLEIIEDLVRFKFSKIPEPLFAIKKRQIMLMEAELNAPGNEVAYILKSKQLFSSD